jgi:hypothetical protein
MKFRFSSISVMLLAALFLLNSLAFSAATQTPNPADLKSTPTKKPVQFTVEQQTTANAAAIKEAIEFSKLTKAEKIKQIMDKLGFTVLGVTENPQWTDSWDVTVYGWFKSKVAPVFQGGISRKNGSEYIYFPQATKPKVLVYPVQNPKGWFLWLNAYSVDHNIGLQWNNTILNKGGVGISPFVQ